MAKKNGDKLAVITFARKLHAAYCPKVVLLFSFTVCNIRKNPKSPLAQQLL